MSKPPRVFSRDFKLMVVRRMLAGENVRALSREMKVARKDLYFWRARFRSGGPEALRGCGRPRKADGSGSRSVGAKVPDVPMAELELASNRIAELERKIGQQALEIDFLKGCLQRIEEQRMLQALTGSPRSTGRSKKK